MPKLTAQDIWNLNETELLNLLETDTFKPISNTIHFYAPSFTYYKTKHYQSNTTAFPTISITADKCALNCKHCGAKVLQTMHPATTPQTLFNLATKLKQSGAKGILISGGCTPNGAVPLDKFTPTIAKIKRELNLTIFVHTGIINAQTANALKQAQIDAALIDILASPTTIQNIYNLNATPQNYTDALHALQNANLTTIPHIIVGLNNGKLDAEQTALQTLTQTKPAAIVIIAFMPIPNTQMAKTPPPTATDIAKVTATARHLFPTTPIALGCMRPKGNNRNQTDILALKAGADAIAFPTTATIEHAKQSGYKIAFSSFCCAQICLDTHQ